MGTSKGYIAPTKPEWRAAKRAVSEYIRSGDSDSRAKAVSRFAEAALTSGTAGVADSSFISAAGNVLGFARSFSQHGLDNALTEFGMADLIGKEPDEVFDALLDKFANGNATLGDSLSAGALSQAFMNLGIEDVEDFGEVDLNILLREMVIEYVNQKFDLCFDEKIGKDGLLKEKFEILKDMHEYISNTLHGSMSEKDIGSMDLMNIQKSSIVSEALQDAYKICIDNYKE
jgi:hypothetical protein